MEQKTEKQNRELKMLQEPIPKVTMEMAVPTIIAFLIMSIYNLADTYFVSSLGTNATAAFFGGVILISGTVFMHPLVRLLGATPTCEEYAIQYATYVLLVAPFMSASFVMNQCLRAEGSAMLSMIGMGFGGILNCFLDPLFIFTMGLGVTGASMATAISKLVSFGILIYPYLTHHSMLRISPRLFRPDRESLYQIFSVGSSSLLRNGLAVAAAVVLNNIAGSISDSVLAGIGVSTKVMMFPFGIILGFGSGYQPVAGFNWGARRFDRVRGCYSFAWKFAVFGSVIMGILLAVFAVPLIHLFSAVDPEMQRIGALCIRLQCLALPIHAWVAMVNMLCGALGFAGWAIILTTARQGTCFLPIVFPMAHFFGGSGLASVQAAADLLTLIPAILILRLALQRIRKEEMRPAL